MTLLPIHITAGIIGVLSGFIALFAVKGARLHRKSGMIFVYAMLALSVTGAVIAGLKHQRVNVVAGCLAFYLVTTALLTVRRRAEGIDWKDGVTALLGLTVGLYSFSLGFEGVNSAKGTIDGYPPAMAFIFGTVALLGTFGDIRMMLARGLQGAHRIARHLWRMCFAMFLATGSFFLGQSQVFPEPIRIVPLLAAPVLLVLALMLYWLARVWLKKRYPVRV